MMRFLILSLVVHMCSAQGWYALCSEVVNLFSIDCFMISCIFNQPRGNRPPLKNLNESM